MQTCSCYFLDFLRLKLLDSAFDYCTVQYIHLLQNPGYTEQIILYYEYTNYTAQFTVLYSTLRALYCTLHYLCNTTLYSNYTVVYTYYTGTILYTKYTLQNSTLTTTIVRTIH